MPTSLPLAISTPGTSVAFGTAAQVELALGKGKHALMSVSVSTPVLATAHDLDVLVRATPQLTGMTVSYIPIHIVKVAGDSLAGVEVESLFSGVSAAGFTMQRLTIRDWRPCSVGPLPAEVDTAGATVTTCVAVTAGATAPPVTAVHYSQGGGPYDESTGTAIVWR